MRRGYSRIVLRAERRKDLQFRPRREPTDPGTHFLYLPAIIMPAPPRSSTPLTIGDTVSLC
jgi:hypothetical protein